MHVHITGADGSIGGELGRLLRRDGLPGFGATARQALRTRRNASNRKVRTVPALHAAS